MKRHFYSVGFAPENRIGKAVELESYDLAGITPESISEAAKLGELPSGFDDSVLNEGRRLGSLPSGIKLMIKRGKKDHLDFDVVVNCLTWIILSDRLAHALKKVAFSDIELLPVAIRGMRREILRPDFCVVNVLRILDAMSESKTLRSRVKMGTNHPVIKLALIGRKVPTEVHVFRVSGCVFDFLVDDVAMRALGEQPHDGLAFIPVEQE